ncbi:MAG: glycosyltransferase family 2 protein [Pseudomonadota bacterium]
MSTKLGIKLPETGERGVADWAIATTCKDRVEVVLAFVAHHLEAGAGEIHLFFDDPEDPAMDWVAGCARVVAYRCDAAHWARLPSGRPERHQRRQGENAAMAKAATACSWIGHIDIDEFLDGPRALSEVLDDVAPEAEALRLYPLERIFTQVPPREGVVFEGAFKRRMSKRLARRLFGDRGDLLHRGFQGHANGKTFLRSGSAAKLHIHNARLPGGERVAYAETEAAHLLHFFPFGYPAWREKFSRRLQVPGTLESLNAREQAKFQLYAAAEAEGEQAVWDLFLELSCFDKRRQRRLWAAGGLYAPALDLRAAVGRVFGPEAPVPAAVPAPERIGWLTRILGW